jgi:hypothetical protein
VILLAADSSAAMVGPYIVKVLPGVPAKLLQGSYASTTLRALLGSVSLACGAHVALAANRWLPRPLRFRNFKRRMETACLLFLSPIVFGIIIYLVVYVAGI